MNTEIKISFYISGTVAAAIVAFVLPKIPKSIYLDSPELRGLRLSQKWKSAFALLWKHFLKSYTRHVIKWSIWYIFSASVYSVIRFNKNELWRVINPSASTYVVIGVQDIICNAFAFTSTVIAGFLSVDWIGYQMNFALALCLVLQGSVCILWSQINFIYLSVTLYVIYSIIYYFMIVIAGADIAANICEESYGLVFAVNGLFGILLKMLLFGIFVFVQISIRTIYLFVGVLYIIFSVGYVINGFVECRYYRRMRRAIEAIEQY